MYLRFTEDRKSDARYVMQVITKIFKAIKNKFIGGKK